MRVVPLLHRLIGRFLLTGDLAAVPLDLLLYFNRNYLYRPLTMEDPDLPWSELLLQVCLKGGEGGGCSPTPTPPPPTALSPLLVVVLPLHPINHRTPSTTLLLTAVLTVGTATPPPPRIPRRIGYVLSVASASSQLITCALAAPFAVVCVCFVCVCAPWAQAIETIEDRMGKRLVSKRQALRLLLNCLLALKESLAKDDVGQASAAPVDVILRVTFAVCKSPFCYQVHGVGGDGGGRKSGSGCGVGWGWGVS
jgi:hypothetical protein